MHGLGGVVLRGEATGVENEQALHHGIHAEREDHGRKAQIGNAHSIQHADQCAAQNAEGNGEPDAGFADPAAQGRGHHGAQRHRPRDRQVDMAEQDDHHGARCDDAEEGADLKLLEQIVGREELTRIERTCK